MNKAKAIPYLLQKPNPVVIRKKKSRRPMIKMTLTTNIMMKSRVKRVKMTKKIVSTQISMKRKLVLAMKETMISTLKLTKNGKKHMATRSNHLLNLEELKRKMTLTETKITEIWYYEGNESIGKINVC